MLFGKLEFVFEDERALLKIGEYEEGVPSRFAEVHLSGEDHPTHMGIKAVSTSEGLRLKYVSHTLNGNVLEIYQKTELVEVKTVFEKFVSNVVVYRNINVNDDIDASLFVEGDDVLTEEEIEEFESLLQNAKSINARDERQISKETSLGYLIKKRSEMMNTYSLDQFNYINGEGHSTFCRIRGLAGSGKTIIMAKRMAFLHYRYPDLKFAFVFYTVSLKQTVQNLFQEFYKEYSPNNECNMDNVYFLHAWGSSSVPGFYSLICNKVGAQVEPYELDFFQRNPFGQVCERLLGKIKEERLGVFDYVFIDEAQDFSVEFFKLVMKSLTETGAFSYAYDELQTLSFSSGIPSKKDIFGNITVRDIDLKTCYRTPKKILVSAHAFGMGIYRDDFETTLPVNIPQDISIWKAIGYSSDPKQVRFGENVSFSRGEPFSKSFVPEEPVVIQKFDNEEEQYAELYRQIKELIRHEDIKPEDIMIIDLDATDFENNFQLFRTYCLSNLRKGNGDLMNPLFKIHLLNKTDRYYFKRDGSIPFTSIFRAKGNEANIVFVINSSKMFSLQSYARNRLFTAMTRSKFKVFIYGCSGTEKFINEYERIKQKNYCLCFKYPTREELNNIQKIAKEEETSVGDIANVVEIAEKLKNQTNANAYYEMLVGMFGKETADELIKKVPKKDND